MVGEDQPEVKQERVALPPPVKRRDLHMRMSWSIAKWIFSTSFSLASVNISQIGFDTSEESSTVNAFGFGLGLSSDPSPKHK